MTELVCPHCNEPFDLPTDHELSDDLIKLLLTLTLGIATTLITDRHASADRVLRLLEEMNGLTKQAILTMVRSMGEFEPMLERNLKEVRKRDEDPDGGD